MKSYDINGREFILEDELTIEQWNKSAEILDEMDVRRIAEVSGETVVVNKKEELLVTAKKNIYPRLLSAVLTDKDGKSEGPEFFAKIKRKQVMEIAQDFLSGEGISLIAMLIDAGKFPKE